MGESGAAEGLAICIVPDLREAVQGADIVIASSPKTTKTRFEFSDLAPSSFVSLVDMGRSFAGQGLSAMASVHTDDIAQAQSLIRKGELPGIGAATLANLPATLPSNCLPRLFLPTGAGAVDIALAYNIWSRARDQQIGVLIAN